MTARWGFWLRAWETWTRQPPTFEDALAFCRKAGYRPELAWTCRDYADALRERDGPGDKEKAVAVLDESLAISSELGMRPLMERVLCRREILKAEYSNWQPELRDTMKQ